MILTIAAFITKMLGFVNGIVLAHVIGPEGVGLIMMAMPVAGLLITLTTLGLPISISKLVAEAEARNDQRRIKKILIVSLATTGIISIGLIIVALFGARIISSIFLTDQRAYYSLLAVIPIIPIVAVSAVIKGYFRGKQNMTPIAMSQVIEQVVRIGFIFVVVHLLLPYGIKFAAAGAVLSGIIGEGVSLLYLFSMFKWTKRKKFRLRQSFFKQVSNGKETLFDLLQTGLPTTGNGLIHSTVGLIQPILITQSLAIAGIGTALATKQYGILMGFAIPLMHLPGFVTHSLSVSLVPAISEANERKDHKLINKRIHQAIRIALIIGVPWTIVLYIFSEQLTTLIYKSPDAGTFIKIMAPFFLLHYFKTPLQAVIIGLGKANVVMINNLVASVLTLPMIFLLASNPKFGIYGVAIAISMGVILGTALHFFTISKLIGFNINSKDFLKVICSGLIMGCTGYITYHYIGSELPYEFIQLGISLLISALIYLVFLLSFRIIDFKKLQR